MSLRPITHEEVVNVVASIPEVEGVAVEDDAIVIHVRNEEAKKKVETRLEEVETEEEVRCNNVHIR